MGDKMLPCPKGQGKGTFKRQHKWTEGYRYFGSERRYQKFCAYCDKTYKECVDRSHIKETHVGNCPVIVPNFQGGENTDHQWVTYKPGFGPIGPKGIHLWLPEGGRRCAKCGCTKSQARKKG